MLGPTAIVVFAQFGIPAAVTYRLARATGEVAEARTRAATLTSALGLSVFGTALYALALLFLQSRVDERAVVPLWIGSVAVAPTLGRGLLTAVPHASPGLLTYNVVRILPIALYAALLVGLVVVSAATLVSVTSAWVIASVVSTAAVLAVVLRAPLDFQGLREEVSAIVRYGRSAYVGTLGAADAQRLVEQAIVAAVLSARELGLWSVAAGATLLVGLFARNVRAAAFPDIARAADPVEAARKANRYLLLTATSSAALALGLVVGAEVLLSLIYGSEFREAAGTLRSLAVASCLVAIRQSMGDSLRAMGRASSGAAAEVANLSMFLVTMLPLASAFGIVGMANAVLIGATAGVVTQVLTTPKRESFWILGR